MEIDARLHRWWVRVDKQTGTKSFLKELEVYAKLANFMIAMQDNRDAHKLMEKARLDAEKGEINQLETKFASYYPYSEKQNG